MDNYKKDNSYMPKKRVSVFISSAMKSEEDTEWKSIRNEISDRLDKCRYINAFIIEKSVSETPAKEYYLYNISICDIVVIIIKNEVRDGVRAEILTANKDKKAILLYFYKGASKDSEAEILKKEFEQDDNCTYKEFDKFESLPNMIYKDIIENVIDIYQYNHYVNSKKRLDVNDNTISNESVDFNSVIVINKETLNIFKNSYGTLSELLVYEKVDSKNSNGNEKDFIGRKILKWIINNEEFLNDNDFDIILKRLVLPQKYLELLKSRYDAMVLYNNGNLTGSIEILTQCLEYAKKENITDWFISDILIDCRNTSIELNGFDERIRVYQKELSNSEHPIYFPLADRFKESSYKLLLDENFKYSTMNPNTKSIGGNLEFYLKEVENYIFTSLIYGSITHINSSRADLAQAIFFYGELYNSPDLLFSAIKLFLIAGKAKQFKETILRKWEILYFLLSTKGDELWTLAKRVDNKKNVKNIVAELFGQYFSDDVFNDMGKYLTSHSKLLEYNHSESFLQVIKKNIVRIKPINTTKILINVLRKGAYTTGSSVTRILEVLDILKVPDDLLEELNNVIVINFDNLISRNGSFHFIAHYIKNKNEIFSEVKKLCYAKFSKIDKMIFEHNLQDNNNYSDIIEELINIAKKQFTGNTKSSIKYSYAIQPYRYIQNIIKRGIGTEELKILDLKFIPHSIKVLESKFDLDCKEDCINCLIDVLILLKKSGIIKFKELDKKLNLINNTSSNEYNLFSNKTRLSFTLRIIILKTILGKDTQREIITQYASFSRFNEYERLTLVESINQIIMLRATENKDVDDVIVFMLRGLSDDAYFMVRKETIKGFINLLKTEAKTIAKNTIRILSTDCSPAIKGEIISLCNKIKSIDKQLSIELINSLKTDVNYGIRVKAEKIIL